MEKVRSAFGLLLALALLAILPASAGAARSWQAAEALPNTTYPLSTNDPRSAQIDGSGNAIVGLNFSGGYRWGFRPHGGPLGPAHNFPASSVLGNGLGLFAMDGLGNVISWDSAYHSAYRAAGGASDFGSGQLSSGLVLYDVAMAPTGEAFGFFKSGDGNGLLAFRQSGALSQFDLPGGTVAPFASGDTSITPLGVTIDPDGAAAAVYKSLPSGALLQTVRPANGSWGAPTVIANVPALAGSTFDHAPDGSAALISRTDTVVRASVRPPGGAFGAEVDVATAGAGQTILISPAIAAVNGGNAVLAFNRSLDGGCGANNDARWEAYGYKSGVGWNLLEQGPSTFPQRSRFDGLDAGGANVGLLVENFVYAGSCGAPGAGSASLDAYIGTHESLGGGSSLGSGASGIFIAVGPAGDALVALNDPASGTVQLRAFEDAAPIGDGGGGSNQGGGNPPITAPSKAVLKGPIVVKQKTATIEFQCNGAYECALVMSLLGAKPKKSASTAKAAAPFAKVKGKVAPGTSKKFKLKLTSAALKKLKAAKSHKLTVFVQSVVTSGGSTSTVVQKATLKR